MKALLIFVLFFFSCSSEVATGNPYALQVNNTNTTPLLEGIQGKIMGSFVQSLSANDNKGLIEMDQQLEQLYQDKKQNLILYWRGYANYYNAIYYAQNKEAKQSEAAINKGIDILESIKGKNSEDFALLASLQGFSMQFKGIKAMFYARKVSKNIQAALIADPENLRANYIAGSNDFYTPEKYGGGKEVEKHLLKALTLPTQKVKNAYLPSWGKEEAYEMLIKYYLRKENLAKAKDMYKKGIAEFPQSYMINQLAGKLI